MYYIKWYKDDEEEIFLGGTIPGALSSLVGGHPHWVAI